MSRMENRWSKGNPVERRVLIAHADPVSRKRLEDLFVRWNIRPAAVADSAEAMRLLMTERFDAAIVDFHLPGNEAHAVVDMLKFNEIPTSVILVARREEEDDRMAAVERSARAMGAAFFFSEPIDAIDLRAVVLKLFELRDKMS